MPIKNATTVQVPACRIAALSHPPACVCFSLSSHLHLRTTFAIPRMKSGLRPLLERDPIAVLVDARVQPDDIWLQHNFCQDRTRHSTVRGVRLLISLSLSCSARLAHFSSYLRMLSQHQASRAEPKTQPQCKLSWKCGFCLSISVRPPRPTATLTSPASRAPSASASHPSSPSAPRSFLPAPLVVSAIHQERNGMPSHQKRNEAPGRGLSS